MLNIGLLKTKNIIEPVHGISNNVVCATSKASDQPAHMRSLIRAFASRLNELHLEFFLAKTNAAQTQEDPDFFQVGGGPCPTVRKQSGQYF